MKNNMLALLLAAILLLTTVLNLWLVHSYHSALNSIRAITPEMARVQNARNVIGALVNDLNEYSRKNPAILPLLQPQGPPPAAAAPAAAKPTATSAKPPGK